MLTKIEMQAMDAVIGIHREMRKTSEVNWEQRRYEIAKEIYCNSLEMLLDAKISNDASARFAIRAADALIEELKQS